MPDGMLQPPRGRGQRPRLQQAFFNNTRAQPAQRETSNNLPQKQKRVLERAKNELREIFGRA